MDRRTFGIRSLRRRFPSESVCLDFIFKRYHASRCACGGEFRRIPTRKKYQCTKCRYQIAPLARTIFEKSKIPLSLWFHALMMFSNAKSGLAAKTIQRDLEITYAAAWRMATLVRGRLKQSEEALFGIVELDTAVLGGKARKSELMHIKSTVFAAVQRGGQMRAEVTKDGSAKSHKNFLWKNVSTVNTRLMTDGTLHLHHAAAPYKRESVAHRRKEYVRGDVHINTIESFWSHVKRSVRGTHKAVSPKHLQSYLNGFVFHYNNARNGKQRFEALVDTVLRARAE